MFRLKLPLIFIVLGALALMAVIAGITLAIVFATKKS